MTVVDKNSNGFLWLRFICVINIADNAIFVDFTYENPNRNLELGKVTEMVNRKQIWRG